MTKDRAITLTANDPPYCNPLGKLELIVGGGKAVVAKLIVLAV